MYNYLTVAKFGKFSATMSLNIFYASCCFSSFWDSDDLDLLELFHRPLSLCSFLYNLLKFVFVVYDYFYLPIFKFTYYILSSPFCCWSHLVNIFYVIDILYNFYCFPLCLLFLWWDSSFILRVFPPCMHSS